MLFPPYIKSSNWKAAKNAKGANNAGSLALLFWEASPGNHGLVKGRRRRRPQDFLTILQYCFEVVLHGAGRLSRQFHAICLAGFVCAQHGLELAGTQGAPMQLDARAFRGG